MIYFHKKTNMVCFDIETIRSIFEKPSRDELLKTIIESGAWPGDFLKDRKKIQEMAGKHTLINDKEDVEVFLAAYMTIGFFGTTNKVCFYMKDTFDPKKDDVSSIQLLKKNIKENHITDFGLLADDGLRLFQVKAYKGKCNAKEFIEFLEKKLKHYSLDLGSTNLHITLQSKGGIEEIFFHNVHNHLKTLGLKGDGEIMITYNENNEFDVLNTVYPRLSTTRLPYRPLSKRIQ